ncbi:MAG TPA: hypothetical protein PLP19_01340 [bacterium]|nr:hypothetical protein [bacterium]HPN42108.1 hypothetical protein [bacterium]
MDHQQVQQDLAIIKDMIEKTKKETADSGYFFIGLGLLSILCVIVISFLEYKSMEHLVVPMFLVMFFASGAIGYFTVNRREQKDKVKSYPKTICYSVWFACSVPVVITGFLLPMLKVIPYSLVPVLTTLILGIGVFATGVIFESRYIYWSSAFWWGGAVAIALVPGYGRAFIMVGILLFGWVLPGIILNRQYKKYGAR